MGTIEKRFGKKILELRKARGWSRQELARKLETSGVVVGRYERDEMVPSTKVLFLVDSVVRDAKARQTYRATV